MKHEKELTEFMVGLVLGDQRLGDRSRRSWSLVLAERRFNDDHEVAARNLVELLTVGGRRVDQDSVIPRRAGTGGISTPSHAFSSARGERRARSAEMLGGDEKR